MRIVCACVDGTRLESNKQTKKNEKDVIATNMAGDTVAQMPLSECETLGRKFDAVILQADLDLENLQIP